MKKIMQQLDKQWFSTNFSEEEPYILTKDEEKSCIENAIESAKQFMVYRISDANQIEARLKSTNWENAIKKDDILKKANAIKHQAQWHEEQRRKEREALIEKRKEIELRCDANYMFKLMKTNCRNRFGKKLIFDDWTKPLITVICYFFSDDPRFNTELKLDDSKGLLIRGSCGLGKTFLTSLLVGNERKRVNIVSMLDVANKIKENGSYSPPKNGILYLDDVGSEQSEVLYYGTKINWFREFMELWYAKKLPFNHLIFSTNNTFDELQEKYGYRLRSRFKEMFNIVDVFGADLRK